MTDGKYNIKPILYAGAGVLTFFLLKKVLETLGIVQPEAQRQSEQAQKKEMEQKSTEPAATITPGQAAIYADQLYNAIRYSAVDDDNGKAVSILQAMKNNNDLRLLVTAFGTRTEYWFGVPVREGNLWTLVGANLNASEKNQVNNTWKSKNIKYTLV